MGRASALENIVADTDLDLISLTADVASAFVVNNRVSAAEVPSLITSIHEALASAGAPPAPKAAAQEPAVRVRSSVKQDYIVCLEDGKKLKMLKRYLRINYNMTPEEYRTKWELPRDYPMIAPAYADQRRSIAKAIGLGRRKASEEAVMVAQTVKRTAKRTIRN
jgi:predicted transcriptional regulator